MTEGASRPDFVIIGAAKSGTTTLYKWLCAQPEVAEATLKEPCYFSDNWSRGLDWYRGLFAKAPAGTLVGEASTNYSDPEFSDLAARRIHDTIPGARLIYLLRQPVDRLRSEYRFRRRRARAAGSLTEAIRQPGNSYLGRSLYHARLTPYIELFPREQICVVRFEDLVDEHQEAWSTVLRHLGLSPRPAPGTVHNATANHPHATRVLAWLRDRGVLDRLPPLPSTVKELGKRALIHPGRRYQADLRASDVEIPESLLAPIWSDVARLEAWLGREEPLWPRPLPSLDGHQQ